MGYQGWGTGAAHGSITAILSADRRTLQPMASSPRWTGAQRRIGLTGGIASGKSSVGRLLAARGYPVLDADQYAREALAPGSPGATAVAERYGSIVVQANKQPTPSLDRAALGRIVFGNTAERCWLENIVHPLVRERFEQDLEQLAGEPVVVLMVPLLFEAGLEGLCSEVWLVDCEPEQQLERLINRDGLNHNEAQDRIKAQWPLERKRPLADRVINNRGTVAMLMEQLD
jgi:dephospho-CoA kinase